MLKALFLALNVRPNEQKEVLLLLGNGFFMGIFLATYQVSAETLFLNRIGEYLKEAILVSGFLGIVTTALFSYLQNKISFAKLALGNLILILALTVVLYLSFQYLDTSIQDSLIFVMFALIGPILAVSLLGFWGTFGRLFDLRQSKRIIGGIDIGQLVAAILTSLAIPFLGALIPNTADYLAICGVSIIISFVFLLIITYNFDLSAAENLQVANLETDSTNFRDLIKNQYVKLLSVFLLFSMIAFTFVQYSFQEVVGQQYPEESELRNFLAIFNGSVLVLGLLLQTFVNDKIIGEYGLKTALMILPIILMVFTAGAIAAGSLYGYTLDAETNFIWFFLLIALSRLFNFSLRDSLENPTFKLYFMPLDASIRFNIQTKVEGVVNETARFIAGILIIGLSYLSFIELIHYSYALILLIIGYIYLIGKMYNEYRNRIKLKLERQQRSSVEEVMTSNQLLVKSLSKALQDDKTNRVIFSFKLLEKIDHQILPQSINKLMGHDSPEIRDFAQQKMNELKGLTVSDRYVISLDGLGVKNAGKQVVEGTDLLDMFQSGGDVSKARLSKLCKSDNSEDRQYAAELLSNSSDDHNISFLIELLSDIDPKVRFTAIKTAQQKYNDEILNSLINNLAYAAFSVPAGNVLVYIGENALPALDSSFYRSGQNPQIMLKIVQIMGRIGGETAKEQLWGKIDYPDKVMVSQVLYALGTCGFKASIGQIPRIKYAIESDIEDIAWNISAINEVSEEYFGKDIKTALEEEVKYDIDHIYMLLSMLYDSQSIQLVKENIESRTSEGIIYAVELLDVFLSEDLKQKVIPVLDDLSFIEKARKLENFYPRDKIGNKLVLKFLINRDFSQTNRWTKTCILYQIGLLEITDFSLDLIANLFNPDSLIREMAAWSLFKIDPQLYHENVNRLNFSIKRKLDPVILRKENLDLAHKTLLFEKVMFLKKIDVFKNIIGLVVAHLVDLIDEVHLSEGKTLTIDENYNNNFYIVYSGSINIYENGVIRGATKEGEFVGELIYNKSQAKSNLIMALDDTVLFKINKDSFYELLSDNVELAQKMVEYV